MLRDERVRLQFDRELLDLIETTIFTAVTVVIDKQEHNQRYSSWRMDPYHYCLHVLVERYVLYLRKAAIRGDVLAESRGGKEDRRLKNSFERVVAEGTGYIGGDVFAEQLTSKQLKVKPKANNIAGLQLADLVAYPAYRLARSRRENERLPDDFGGRIAALLRDRKLHRDPAGKLDGWGIKWLP